MRSLQPHMQIVSRAIMAYVAVFDAAVTRPVSICRHCNHYLLIERAHRHEEAVTCLAAFLGPHGAEAPVLFSGARDCDARIWNMLTMKCERVLSGHRDEVLCVAVLASTRKRGVLATGCEDGTINVWGIVQT
eukprot:m.251288 g.251288  ORF g.251288 m.251288 type:complete len:132 (+) comp19536_c0_seq10:1937-2332(+)